MIEDSAMKPFTVKQKRATVLILSIIFFVLLFLGFYAEQPYSFSAFFFAFPVFLLLLSLMWGSASKGKGIFSVFTLYLIGLAFILGSVLVFIETRDLALLQGFGFGIVIIVFGKLRAKNKT